MLDQNLIPTTILLPLLGAHILAAMSPGANTILTLEAASQYRTAGLVTAAGFWPAGVLWSIIGLWGMEALICTAPRFVLILNCASTLYLAWMAYGMIRSSFHASKKQIFNQQAFNSAQSNVALYSLKKCSQSRPPYQSVFIKAFLINLFNPKSVVYFSSIFTATGATALPLFWKWAVVLGLPLIGFVWYSTLVFFINQPPFGFYYRRYAYWVSRIAGSLLLLLAGQFLLAVF